MRNVVELGGGVLPDIGVYPTIGARFATGMEPKSVSAKVVRDPKFGTDIYSSAQVDFETFELSMYVSTQMALRQSMCFHGTKGWIEFAAPFNAGKYDADVVTLHNAGRDEATSFRFAGTDQYQLQIEAFARAVMSDDPKGSEEMFTLEQSKLNQKLIDAIYRAGETGMRESV